MPLFFPPVGLSIEFPDCPCWFKDEAFHASRSKPPPLHSDNWEVCQPSQINHLIFKYNKRSSLSNLTQTSFNQPRDFIDEPKADFF